MKRKIYFSILLMAALSCSRETMIEDTSSLIPDGERLSFVADLDNTVKSHFADDGTTLEWDTTDRVYVSSAHAEDGEGNALVGADKWGSSFSEIMAVKIDEEHPTRATFLSGKSRSAWVNAGDGKYSFYAIYPASSFTSEISPIIDEENLLWVPVEVPYSQDGKHFGKYQVCVDFTGTAYSKDAILENTTTIQFNQFKPKTALLNFNATSATGDVSIDQISITASWVDWTGHTYSPEISGCALVSETGEIKPGWSHGIGCYNNVYIDLDTPITIGATAGERILAAIIPTSDSAGEVKLNFTAFDVDGNPRLEGSLISPAEGFLPGKKYTFTVAMEEAETSVLAFDGERNFPPEGGTYTGRLISYNYVDGNKVAVNWDCAYYSDPSCAEAYKIDPDDIFGGFDYWIHLTGMSDSATETGVKIVEYGVDANHNIETISLPDDATEEIRAELQGATPRGKATQPWNLATPDGSFEPTNFSTANCYIVNQPGYYVLPCVAGNGIKNGSVNTSAFVPPSGYDGEDPLFVDYLGIAMSNPIIGQNPGNGTPTSACLLWEDHNGLIATGENYSLQLTQDQDTGIYGILFEIPEATIDQGNAVLAVKDENGIIMWSWHIWVTDYNRYVVQNIIPVKSYWSQGRYNFMKRNLGWVMTGTSDRISYKPNSLYMKVWQTDDGGEPLSGGKEITISFQQNGMYLYDANIQHGYGPYWQAGRKDPFTPGSRGADGYMHDVTVYGTLNPGGTGANFKAMKNPLATIALGIQNPDTYYYHDPASSGDLAGGWFADNVSNAVGSLWNNISSTAVSYQDGSIAAIISAQSPAVKTIYDPNPVGFVMPPMDAGGTFFAFFVGGKYENYLTELAGDDTLRDNYISLLISASEYGALFYASTDKDPNVTGFLPQVGRRHSYFDGQFQNHCNVSMGLSESVDELANVPTCGGYYSNIVGKDLSVVMLCSYPNMYFGFLTVSNSALPVRSLEEYELP